VLEHTRVAAAKAAAVAAVALVATPREFVARRPAGLGAVEVSEKHLMVS
jgi:hypothetical protein